MLNNRNTTWIFFFLLMNFPVSLALIVLHATLSEKLKTPLKGLASHFLKKRDDIFAIAVLL